MSRIRVYELAKEAGMSSKVLADKLLEQGYDIKGHSSTVDDDTAEKIRNTILKSTDTELVEKRISGSTGPTVIRRRATVIRRRPKAEEVPSKVETEEAETVAETAGVDSHVAATFKEDSETSEPVIEKEEVGSDGSITQDEAEEGESTLITSAELDSAIEEKDVDEGVAVEGTETDKEKSSQSEPATVSSETTLAEESETVKVEKKKPATKKKTEDKTVARKGIARVVGTIELPAEKPEPVRARKKAAKSPQQRRAKPKTAPVATTPAPVREEVGRGKKKGKKGTQATEEKGELRKSGKKGKKNVKFTHFANNYQGKPGGGRGKRGGRRAPKPVAPPSEMKASKKRFKVYDTISIGDLALRMRVKASDVIAKLMGLGVMATINQSVDTETAIILASDFGYEVEQGITEELGVQRLNEAESGGEQQQRSPVVTVMGHVDHGKTSILDAIRKTDVAEGEAGGITQHIGAYHVRSSAGDVTFVDTPGHAAFTEMRSRGAQVTDIVILVVAADDGVMDQTREAISHSKAAGVPIIVAVNKIDKDNADIDRVKRELAEVDLAPEEWGGETMYCETSAKNNIGIDNLMEMIQLQAEILELEADKNRKARGRVVEAQLHKGRGAVATVLIQDGTLRPGEHFVVGQYSGKVRAMLDFKGKDIKEAGPSIPVEVQGLSGVPSAGDEFVVVTDEKMARSVSQVRALKARESELGANTKISLDKLFEQMSEGEVRELRVVLRSDVQGTLEAFAKAAEELSTKVIKVRVLHEGTGTITESDILLASASDAIIIGFNVRPSVKVKELAVKESVDVRSYDVIYHALDDIRKAMVGMLEPTFEEEVIGLAEVRETFHVPKIGTIAGSAVVDGKILRNSGIRVLRDGVVIYTGKIESLRRFKDDVKEVVSGYECGIGVAKFNDIKVGDNLEAYVMTEVEATL
jgi:translation initiation factor IF-2